MADFSLIEEILKEAVGTLGGGALLVLGGWLTLRATLAENREKLVEDRRKVLEEHRLELEKAVWERREALIAETLINAYRDIERVTLREPGLLGHDRLPEYQAAMERAIGDIQLLGDEDSVRLAAAFVQLMFVPEAGAAANPEIVAEARRMPGFDPALAGSDAYMHGAARAALLHALTVAMRRSLRRRLRYDDGGADLPVPLVLRFHAERAPARPPASG